MEWWLQPRGSAYPQSLGERTNSEHTVNQWFHPKEQWKVVDWKCKSYWHTNEGIGTRLLVEERGDICEWLHFQLEELKWRHLQSGRNIKLDLFYTFIQRKSARQWQEWNQLYQHD
jgi:hypothetical protein